MSSLRHYRQAHRMTMKELASEMDLDVGVVNRIERNIGNRTVRKVLVWCLKKGIDPLDVFPVQPSA